jgi:hypothetical protein
MRQNKNYFSRVVDVNHGKTLAANLPVARPVDQNLLLAPRPLEFVMAEK